MAIVIIGGGLAGARAAQTLRECDYKGEIVLISSESHLPYERPPLSKAVLLNRQDLASCTILPQDYYQKHRIELRLNVRCTGIERAGQTVTLSDGSTLFYKQLILATGLRARQLQGFNLGEALVTLRNADDALRLKTRLIPGTKVLIVGGGFLGLELAATARQLGCAVTVVERHESLLYKAVSADLGQYVLDLHKGNGVHVIQNVAPAKMSLTAAGPLGPQVKVTLSNGETLYADTVVSAIGSILNTELAESCGLEVDDGVVVDDYGRTSDPNIFAIGDISRHFNPILGRTIRVESWQNAQNQAVAIAKVITGGSTPYAEVPWFWTDQYDMNLQIFGYPQRWDMLIKRGDTKAHKFILLYLNEGRVIAANLVNCRREARVMRRWVSEGAYIDTDRFQQADIVLEDTLTKPKNGARPWTAI